MNNNLVSIIVPVYNAENTIERALYSCLNQSYKNLEVIIIDNASTDCSKEKIQQINDSRLLYFYTSIKGRSNARNIGIEHANGEYLIFLDADDELDFERLSIGVKNLELDSSYFGHVAGITYNKENEEVNYFARKSDFESLIINNPFPINSILFRKTSQLFDINIEYNEDWLYFGQLLIRKKLLFEDAYSGGIVYIHGNNTMSNIDKMIESKLIVRSMLKRDYRYKMWGKVFIDDMKLLVYYHFLKKEKLSYYEIKKRYRYKYTFISLLMKISLIEKKANKIVNNRLEEIMYN